MAGSDIFIGEMLNNLITKITALSDKITSQTVEIGKIAQNTALQIVSLTVSASSNWKLIKSYSVNTNADTIVFDIRSNSRGTIRISSFSIRSTGNNTFAFRYSKDGGTSWANMQTGGVIDADAIVNEVDISVNSGESFKIQLQKTAGSGTIFIKKDQDIKIGWDTVALTSDDAIVSLI